MRSAGIGIGSGGAVESIREIQAKFTPTAFNLECKPWNPIKTYDV